MNNSILVNLYVPAAQTAGDVFLPRDVPLAELLPIMGSAVTRLSGNLLICDDMVTLCERETGHPLDIGKTAEELGLRNGSRIMLI